MIGVRKPAPKHFIGVLFLSVLLVQLFSPSQISSNTRNPSSEIIPKQVIECSLSFENGKNSVISSISVEGWPAKLSLSKKWQEFNVGSYRLTTSEMDVLSIVSPSFPDTKFILQSGPDLKMTKKCLTGEIQQIPLSDVLTEFKFLAIDPKVIQNTNFELLVEGQFIPAVTGLFKKISSGLLLSLFLYFLFYILRFLGAALKRNASSAESFLIGFFGFNLILGGLHYFLNVLQAGISSVLLLLTFSFILNKRIDLGRLKSNLFPVDKLHTIIIITLPQFFSAFYFRNIGLLQTDTFNYRAQVKNLSRNILLNQSLGSEGNGFRSIDYSLRSFLGSVSHFSPSATIALWTCSWLLVLVSGFCILTARLRVEFYIKLLLIAICCAGIVSIWVEAYLSRFSYAISAIVIVIFLYIKDETNEKNLNWSNSILILLASAYCFSIIPVFLAPMIILPLTLIFSKNFKDFVKYSLLFVATGLPASIWMRGLSSSINLSNDGGLNNIARYILVPNYKSLYFLAQLSGTLSWHGSGFRSPTAGLSVSDLGFFNSFIISATPYLTIFGLLLFLISILLLIKNFRFSDSISLYIVIFCIQFAGMIYVISLYTNLMYLITLFPSVLLALSLIVLKSRYSSFFISIWGALAVLVIITETSFWMHGAEHPISKESYWANHFYVDKVNMLLKDERFVIRQGEYASEYSFDVRRSELVLASNSNNCTNCKVTSTGILDQVPTISADKVVVIYGKCRKSEEFIMSIDAYTVCRIR
jgi:hypothetical protein